MVYILLCYTAVAKHKAAVNSTKDPDTSTSSGSPVGASTDGGTASDAPPPSASRSRSAVQHQFPVLQPETHLDLQHCCLANQMSLLSG